MQINFRAGWHANLTARRQFTNGGAGAGQPAQWLTIGNLQPWNDLTVAGVKTGKVVIGSYCYIEEVSVKLIVDTSDVNPCPDCGPTTGLVLPNVITPNGDGANDRLFEGGPHPATFEIFDRWGRRVADGRDAPWTPDNCLPDGTYFFRATFITSTVATITRGGSVVLLR